jgi:hypothetical protein
MRYLVRRFLEKLNPQLIAGVGDEQPGDAASHAVADHDHLLVQWETLLDSVQFMVQDCSGIGIGVAAWIALEPKLVVAPDLLITTQAVEHRCPGRGRVHEPMDHQYNNFVWIVGLEPRDTGRLRVLGRVEHAGEFEFLRVGAREHHGERITCNTRYPRFKITFLRNRVREISLSG